MASATPADTQVETSRRWSVECSAALNGVYAMWYRDVLRSHRARARIFLNLAQPLVILLLFGVGLSPTIGSMGRGSDGPQYVQFMLPGIVAMAVFFTAIHSAASVIWDRETGFLKVALVAPVPRWALVVGKALGSSTTAMVRGTLMLAVAPLVGVGLTPLTLVAVVPAMFLTAFGLSALGLLIAARLRNPESFQTIMGFLVTPLFVLSGAFYPIGNLPGWLWVLTVVNPVSYGVDAIREIVLLQSGVPPEVLGELGLSLLGYRPGPLLDLAVVAMFATLTIALAVRAFEVQE